MEQIIQQSPTQSVFNLVVGLIGPYGAGSTSLTEELSRNISEYPNCLVKTVHVASLIKQIYPLLTEDVAPMPGGNGQEKRKYLQKAGTDLRLMHRELVGTAIVSEIFRQGKESEDNGDLKDKKILVFLVDSVKNSYDVKVLKQIYGKEFFLVAIHAPHEDRWRRMKQYKSWTETERADFEECDKIDSDEKTYDAKVGDAGQQVSKVAATADYHIANTHNREQLTNNCSRFVELLFGFGSSQPTIHERSMHLAFSAAGRSYCLSKQVGAAIVDSSGNILGIGHNDVPKALGGLYQNESTDKRCYQVGDCRCSNDTNKQERFEQLYENIFKTFPIDNKEELQKIISASQFRESTEYCRAVHAEMEALLSILRNPGRSTVGTSMYVTTYPCHNCTKHILCAGIKEVHYIEPYPKSLAEELHSDAIIFFGQEGDVSHDKVQFIPYHGVAPHTYDDFFLMNQERKDDDGRLIRKTKLQAVESPLFAKDLSRRARSDDSDDRTTLSEKIQFNSFMEMIGPAKEKKESQNGRQSN